jgi:hypothetical protein
MDKKIEVMVRFDTTKGFVESGTPLLIFPYERANIGLVACKQFNYGEGDMDYLIRHSTPINSQKEIERVLNENGYSLNEVKVIKRANKDRIKKEAWGWL